MKRAFFVRILRYSAAQTLDQMGHREADDADSHRIFPYCNPFAVGFSRDSSGFGIAYGGGKCPDCGVFSYSIGPNNVKEVPRHGKSRRTG